MDCAQISSSVGIPLNWSLTLSAVWRPYTLTCKRPASKGSFLPSTIPKNQCRSNVFLAFNFITLNIRFFPDTQCHGVILRSHFMFDLTYQVFTSSGLIHHTMVLEIKICGIT